MGRYRISFDPSFVNVPRGEWRLVVREALDGDWTKSQRVRIEGREMDALVAYPQWEAVWEFIAHDGAPVLCGVQVRSSGVSFPEGGLPARVVHRLKTTPAYTAAHNYIAEQLALIESGEFVEAYTRQLAHFGGDPEGRRPPPERIVREFAKSTPSPDSWPARAAGYHLADALKGPRRRGRRGRDDTFFAAFAAEYVDLLETAPERPVAELAERRHLTPEYVRDVLHQARERGLLTRPPRGKAGGALSENALALLSHSNTEKETP